MTAGQDWRDPAEFYRDHAAEFDGERSRALRERGWLDAFLALLPPRGSVLDLGCGAGDPIAAYLLGQGARVTGVDASAPLLDLARGRLPQGEWIEADMRGLDLGRQFDGILAWDSFFHLTEEAQRACFRTFGRHAAPSAALMFTTGDRYGAAVNPLYGEPLYHMSLDPGAYRALLAAEGFAVVRHVAGDPECGERTIWLAQRGGR